MAANFPKRPHGQRPFFRSRIARGGSCSASAREDCEREESVAGSSDVLGASHSETEERVVAFGSSSLRPPDRFSHRRAPGSGPLEFGRGAISTGSPSVVWRYRHRQSTARVRRGERWPHLQCVVSVADPVPEEEVSSKRDGALRSRSSRAQSLACPAPLPSGSFSGAPSFE
jgi:hypothetical protein